jgi:hypothetical protein
VFIELGYGPMSQLQPPFLLKTSDFHNIGQLLKIEGHQLVVSVVEFFFGEYLSVFELNLR